MLENVVYNTDNKIDNDNNSNYNNNNNNNLHSFDHKQTLPQLDK